MILTEVDRANLILSSIARLIPFIGRRLVESCPDLANDLQKTVIINIYGIKVQVPIINVKQVAVWEEYAKGN